MRYCSCNPIISVSILICGVIYVAASAKFTVMANCSPLKQTNNSQDLSIEKRPKISRFISELVFCPAPIQSKVN